MTRILALAAVLMAAGGFALGWLAFDVKTTPAPKPPALATPALQAAASPADALAWYSKAAAAGYQEPSLVFMTGTATLLTDGSAAADFLGQGSCRFALVEWGRSLRAARDRRRR